MSKNFGRRRARFARTRAATALALAGALMMSMGLVALSASAASATNDEVCTGLDSGKIDTTGNPMTVTVTAPEGMLISGYCVKAGSENQGDGPQYIAVNPPQESITFGYTSVGGGAKAVSHYAVSYVPDVVDVCEDLAGDQPEGTECDQPKSKDRRVERSDESCELGGVRTWIDLYTTPYVFDSRTNTWVLGDETGPVEVDVLLTPYTAQELIDNLCDRPSQPEPEERRVEQREESCELGGVSTWVDVYTTEYVFNEETWQWELGTETGPVRIEEAFQRYTLEERLEKGCDEIAGTEQIAAAVSFEDPTCALPNRATWAGSFTDLVDYTVSGTPGRGKSIVVTANIKPAVAEQYAFPEGFDNTFAHSYPSLADLACVKGSESVKPKPEKKPTVLGTQAAVPTAVAAGVGSGSSATASTTSLLAQLMVAGGLLLLLAGGWLGLGRREHGAHQA